MSHYIVDALLNGFMNYMYLFIFFVGIEFILYKYYLKRNIKVGWDFLVGYQVLVCLLIIILAITGVGDIRNLIQCIQEKRFVSMNFEIMSSHFQTYDGKMNILMFVPFGLLLPIVFKSAAKWYQTIICGGIFSLLIEFSQILTIRASDMNDVLCNTIGMMIGYLLFFLFFKRVHITLLDDHGKLSSYHHDFQVFLIFFVFFIVGSPIIYFLNGF